MNSLQDAPARPLAPPRGTSTVAVVINPASGGAADDDAELRGAFDALVGDVLDEPVEWLETTEDDPGTGQARSAVERGATTVVACGGDGTVRACLEALADTDTALGVVPLGTGNLLASNLELPTGDAAPSAAVSGPVRRLDVGTVNGETFAVMAGSGFDALMIRDANPATKRRIGSAAYVFSALRNLPVSLVHTTVTVDDRTVFRGRTAMVLVGNCGAVTGGLEVFPGAQPDDGVLDVAVLTAAGPMQWMSVFWRLLRGLPQRRNLVARHTGRRIRVETSKPRPYELDGEDRPATRELEYTIRPRALAVHTAPADGDGKAAAGNG
ncbi:MAG TPA: diacylglycerol kinase family protein [Ilumatobacteraceae bacterium]